MQLHGFMNDVSYGTITFGEIYYDFSTLCYCLIKVLFNLFAEVERLV